MLPLKLFEQKTWGQVFDLSVDSDLLFQLASWAEHLLSSNPGNVSAWFAYRGQLQSFCYCLWTDLQMSWSKCPKVLASTAKSAWLRDNMVVVNRGVLYVPQMVRTIKHGCPRKKNDFGIGRRCVRVDNAGEDAWMSYDPSILPNNFLHPSRIRCVLPLLEFSG